MLPFELRGDGILLAVPTEADVDRITELCQDPDTQRWTTMPAPYRREHAEAFVNEVAPRNWTDGHELTWAVRDPEDRRVLGMIGVGPVKDARAEVGFWLAPEARGAKVMSRAVRLVAQFVFDPDGLGLTHLGWSAMVGNWASRRVAWATGFRMEGTIRGGVNQRGELRDAWKGTLCAGEALAPRSPWLDIPTLHGEHVVLRRFVETDADMVAEACSDPVSQHWLGGLPSPYTREIALAYIHDREEEAATGRGIHWAAAPPGGGPAIGSFSLMDLQSNDGGAEVGYWTHPAARGRGIATAAVRLMIRHAFAETSAGGMGLRRLSVAHVTGNDASRTVIERTGFRPYGVERAGARIRGGTIVDLHWYDLLTDDVRLPRATQS